MLRWIGKGDVPEIRWNSHCHFSCNEHLRRAIKKYGVENFDFFVIEERSTAEQAYEAETELIQYLRSIGARLYNMNDGGVGGINPTKEVRDKIRKAYKRDKDVLQKRSEGIKKTKSDPEKRKHYSVQAKRVNGTFEARKRHSNNAKRLWESTEFQEKQRLTRQDYCSTHKRKDKPHRGKSVDQMTIDGKFIQTHISLSFAAKSLKINRALIRNCCDGKRSVAYGFTWRYTSQPRLMQS